MSSPSMRKAVLLPTLLAAFLMCDAASASPRPSVPNSTDQRYNEHYALIVGTVWGADGRAAYGIKVQIRRVGAKKVLGEEYSNHTGEVAFRVPPGKADYVLTADVKHSKQKGKPEIKAHVENEERVEVGLHLTE